MSDDAFARLFRLCERGLQAEFQADDTRPILWNRHVYAGAAGAQREYDEGCGETTPSSEMAPSQIEAWMQAKQNFLDYCRHNHQRMKNDHWYVFSSTSLGSFVRAYPRSEARLAKPYAIVHGVMTMVYCGSLSDYLLATRATNNEDFEIMRACVHCQSLLANTHFEDCAVEAYTAAACETHALNDELMRVLNLEEDSDDDTHVHVSRSSTPVPEQTDDDDDVHYYQSVHEY